MNNDMNLMMKVAVAMDAYTSSMSGNDRKWALIWNAEYDNILLDGFQDDIRCLKNEVLIGVYDNFPSMVEMYYQYREFVRHYPTW